ncbi:hypothetical protein BDW62DRAFT_192689 [Aspergillus aurantiobrunneus]
MPIRKEKFPRSLGSQFFSHSISTPQTLEAASQREDRRIILLQCCDCCIMDDVVSGEMQSAWQHCRLCAKEGWR